MPSCFNNLSTLDITERFNFLFLLADIQLSFRVINKCIACRDITS